MRNSWFFVGHPNSSSYPVLRTTTAEPVTEGTTWIVEKDISIYSNYLYSTPGLVATLNLPNNVDATYTGVIYADVMLTFYEMNEQGASAVPQIIPLTKNPGSFASVNGNTSLDYPVSLENSECELFLEIYASNHGCEEFYYSNVPDEFSTDLGICGGGIYREIQVHIDGSLAAATFHFPVIYSGGNNPLFWRPMAGIMQFDIPPHR